ncbi:MAG: hypothetical protein M1473_04315 [Firmicutes bacterium]|nr:hypothetical protein [Bacillota bacterium]
MLTVHQLLLYAHIGFGALALVLFWLPFATRKGSVTHRRIGRWYVLGMYIVSGTGVAMSLMVLAAPGYFKPNVPTAAVYVFWALLLFLSLLTLVNVRLAMLVLQYKHRPEVFRQARYLWMPLVMLAGGIGLVIIAFNASQLLLLHYIFGVLGVVTAAQMLQLSVARTLKPNTWLLQHISATIGSGIALYTAFMAFGARQFLGFLGDWQLLAWIIPGIVGSFAIAWISKRYRQHKHA